MKIINSIKLENHIELKKELVLNWLELDTYGRRPSNPMEIAIYDLLDIETNFIELQKTKEYLKQFDLEAFQVVVYCPFARTGFHIDGGKNRYIIPIQTHKDSINFELDKIYNDKKLDEFYQQKIGWNGGLSTIPVKYEDWLYQAGKDNFAYHIEENKCIEIGPNFHAHVNHSPTHRIVIVFDTKNKINE